MFVADGSDSNHGGDLGGDVFEDIKGPPRVGHRYYDAVDALVHEVRHGVLNGLRRHFAQGCDADEIARLPRRLLDSEERVRWPVLRHFAAEYANGLGSPCYQASCGGVPTVPPQLCDGLLHALAGLELTLGWLFNTRETVWWETPATRATSSMTGGRGGAVSSVLTLSR